jgi:hypothetical protein
VSNRVSNVRGIRGHLGNRRIGAAIACTVLGVGLVAAQHSAGAVTNLVYYEGQATGDRNSHLQFDAVEGKTRIVRVTRFSFARVDVNCKYGEDRVAGFAYSHGFRVGPDQHFRGTERARYGKIVVAAQLRGHFAPSGIALGRLKVKTGGDQCLARWRAVPREVTGP